MITHYYRVERYPDLGELIKKVDQLVESGWIPTGGMSISLSGYFYQALYNPKGQVINETQNIYDESHPRL